MHEPLELADRCSVFDDPAVRSSPKTKDHLFRRRVRLFNDEDFRLSVKSRIPLAEKARILNLDRRFLAGEVLRYVRSFERGSGLVWKLPQRKVSVEIAFIPRAADTPQKIHHVLRAIGCPKNRQ
jgi:hypothetical protein